jgi:hypothetical protein
MSDNPSATTTLTGLNQATDYHLKCVILTSDGTQHDVSNLILHLNLYEGLFSPCMTGDIALSDALDFITNQSLHGNEYVYVYLDKPSLDNPIEKYFRIYKISNRGAATQSVQNYKIHFCSEELILSSQMYVRKSYRGMTIDSMIKDLLSGVLKVSPSKISKNFESLSGNYDFIIPRMQPLEAALWLTSRAYGDNRNAFFFYENRDGFNFSSFENLIKSTSNKTYFWQPNVTRDPSDNINSIRFLNVDNDFDVLKGNRFGQFANSLQTYDLVSRKMTLTKLKGTDLPSNRLLNTALPENLSKNRLGNTLFDATDSMVKFMAISDSDPTVNGIKPQNWVMHNAMKMAQLERLKMTIVVPGDFTVKSGMTVNLKLPMLTPQNRGEKIDKYRTAKYLVSAVHHGISGDISGTTLELLSDSFSQKVPSSNDFSNSSQKLKQQ